MLNTIELGRSVPICVRSLFTCESPTNNIDIINPEEHETKQESNKMFDNSYSQTFWEYSVRGA